MHKVDRFQSLTVRFALILLVAGALSFSVLGQSSGGVKGKVRNMAGDRIAGATVTARQNSRDVRSSTSNKNGEFQLTGLDAGTYNIVFEARGYSSGIKYNVEVKPSKTIDLGDRLIMQVDRGTQVIIQGSVFFKDGTSVPAAKILIEKIEADGSARKAGNVTTNVFGEFVFRRPEGAAKYRVTAEHRDARASKEIEVDSAAIYRLAISLDASRRN